jgi:type IV pilus assembly protein PilO
VKSPSKNILLASMVGGLAVVAAGGYLLLVAPQRSKAADLSKQVAAAQSQLAAAQSAARLGRQHQQVRIADVFRLGKAMPTTPDIPDVLLELNRISNDSGIVFQSITPGAATPANGYSVLPISLVFQGNYYNLNDFLFRVRNLVRVDGGELASTGRLYNVASIGFAEGEKKFPQVQATVSVDAYVYAGAAAVPGTASVAAASTGTTPTSTTSTSPTTSTTPAGPQAAAGATG